MVKITAVYIPPQADTNMALWALHDVLCRHHTQHPDAAVVVDRSVFKTTDLNVYADHITGYINDYRPVALIPIAMKNLEKLVMKHIKSIIPDSLDPLQFAYRPNRSVDNVISLRLHTALEHLQEGHLRQTVVYRVQLCVHHIVPSKRILKLRNLGLGTHICNWIMDFLSGRPQVVPTGSNTSSTLVLNTSATRLLPQPVAVIPVHA